MVGYNRTKYDDFTERLLCSCLYQSTSDYAYLSSSYGY